MGQRMKYPDGGNYGREWVTATSVVVVGASGAVTSQTGAKEAGFTVVKNAAAGRYDITFDEKVSQIVLEGATIVGHASAAYTTTDGGMGPTYQRNVNPSARTTQVQFSQISGADANVPSGFSFQLTFAVKTV